MGQFYFTAKWVKIRLPLTNFSITREENVDGKHILQLTLEIPADQFDEIALAWCKKRNLHGAMGGPVGLEFGSPGSGYPQEYRAKCFLFMSVDKHVTIFTIP